MLFIQEVKKCQRLTETSHILPKRLLKEQGVGFPIFGIGIKGLLIHEHPNVGGKPLSNTQEGITIIVIGGTTGNNDCNDTHENKGQ